MNYKFPQVPTERLKPTKNLCDFHNTEVIIHPAVDGLCAMYKVLLFPLNSGSNAKQNNNHNNKERRD